MNKLIFLTIGILMALNLPGFSQELKIVTIDSPLHEVLKQKTELIQENELPLAQEIAAQLFKTLQPHLPAAGLAAPQIGISKAVFIYSYDRNPEHLEVVINPSFEPIGDEIVEGWEACFSVILSEKDWKVAKVPRYAKIRAIYLNQNGEKVEKILDGFGAKVFQHEYDHLDGIENIEREDAIVKAFTSREELFEFMQAVKKEDANRYNAPK